MCLRVSPCFSPERNKSKVLIFKSVRPSSPTSQYLVVSPALSDYSRFSLLSHLLSSFHPSPFFCEDEGEGTGMARGRRWSLMLSGGKRGRGGAGPPTPESQAALSLGSTLIAFIAVCLFSGFISRYFLSFFSLLNFCFVVVSFWGVNLTSFLRSSCIFSLPLSIYLTIYLRISISLTIYLSLYLYLCPTIYLYIFVHLSLSLSISISYPSLSLIYLCLFHSVPLTFSPLSSPRRRVPVASFGSRHVSSGVPHPRPTAAAMTALATGLTHTVVSLTYSLPLASPCPCFSPLVLLLTFFVCVCFYYRCSQVLGILAKGWYLFFICFSGKRV